MTSDFQEEMLLAYSDEELAGYIRASPHHDSISRVSILSTNLVAKVSRPDTVHTEDITRAMEMAQQLGVRVPCIKRILTFDGTTFCVMERINGSTLNEAWTKLSWFTTIKLGLQLRRFIHLLRLATSSTAGSLASGECRSFYLKDRFGLPARSSPEVITYFIKFWSGFSSLQHAIEAADHGVALGSKIHPNRFIPPTDTTLVLNHHDLAPRNILLDYSGQLWLLDWDYAGWYPRYFEYAGMQNFHIPPSWNLVDRIRWTLFTSIAVGRFEKERRVLKDIRTKFTEFREGRRFELLAVGGPSRYPPF
ncbi:hypothetical protein ACLOAV_009970 [Pseudogymnoascus australis]